MTSAGRQGFGQLRRTLTANAIDGKSGFGYPIFTELLCFSEIDELLISSKEEFMLHLRQY